MQDISLCVMQLFPEGETFTNQRVINGEGNKTIIQDYKNNYKIVPNKKDFFSLSKVKIDATIRLTNLLKTIGENNIYLIKINPLKKPSGTDQFIQSFYYHLLMKYTNSDYKMVRIKDNKTKTRIAIIYNCENVMNEPSGQI